MDDEGAVQEGEVGGGGFGDLGGEARAVLGHAVRCEVDARHVVQEAVCADEPVFVRGVQVVDAEVALNALPVKFSADFLEFVHRWRHLRWVVTADWLHMP